MPQIFPEFLSLWKSYFVVGDCFFVPSCPDHEIITQKLYYLSYCLANHLSVLLANPYIFGSPIYIFFLFCHKGCSLLARFWLAACIFLLWQLHDISLTPSTLSLYIYIYLPAWLYSVKSLVKSSFFIH